MAKISAFNCRVKSGSTIISAKEFNADPKVAKLDTMNFESAGFGEYQGGAADCDLDFTFDYDDAAAVLGTFIPGSVVPVEVDITKLGTKKFTGNMYVEHAPFKAQVRGMVVVQVVGCTSGAYVYPT